jgi:hypothetical protein
MKTMEIHAEVSFIFCFSPFYETKWIRSGNVVLQLCRLREMTKGRKTWGFSLHVE